MQEIVVGVDDSPAAQAALVWALREAAVRRAPLVAVHAWLMPVYGFSYPGMGALPDVGPAAAQAAQNLVDDRVKQACDVVPGADTVDIRTVAAQGAPAQALVERSTEAALVVVGSRSEGLLSRAVLGSVSSSVLHHARCPVVVVPRSDRTGAGQTPAPAAGRVVVGIDHSDPSLVALKAAVEQARRHGAVLVPVLVREPSRSEQPGLNLTLLEASERQAMLSAAHEAGATDLTVEPEVLTGHASASLTGFAQPQDLLVVGSRGRGGFTGLLLGSTSTQCAQHARCPVLVVHP